MQKIISDTQLQFLELLRSGLWGRMADLSLFQGEVNWIAIMRIARQQAVFAIIADAIELLPDEMRPSKELMMQSLMIKVKIYQSHDLLNAIILQIDEAFRKVGIPYVLLKGQGVARNYRIPRSRSCGDVDIYVGEEKFRAGIEVIASLGDSDPAGAHLSVKGVEVELHRMADYTVGARSNKSLQLWTRSELDANFNTAKLQQWDNNGCSIPLPPVTYDAFFILHHAFRHMVSGGVGFRQICDWVMLLHHWHKDIDVELLSAKLQEFRMVEVWREFGVLAVNALGLPLEEVPLVSEADLTSGKTSKILKQIFISGNFGHFDANQKDNSKTTYLKGKIRSFRYQGIRLVKLSSIFPRFCLHYFISWFGDAVVKILRLR